MNELEKTVKELGFENEKEFHSLVASVNFKEVPVIKFKEWQFNDGTKTGLLKLIKKFSV